MRSSRSPRRWQQGTAFDKAHPGDTVTIDLVNNDNYKTQIANAMTAGNEPQIFWTVAGGTGHPADLAGNTASYVAISTNSTPAQRTVAEEFFQQELASPTYAKAQVAAGEVPVTAGSSADFGGNLASFDTTIYNDVQKAPSFQYSWDQATAPGVSAEMLTDLSKLFDLSITPAAMASDLNSYAAKDAAS